MYWPLTFCSWISSSSSCNHHHRTIWQCGEKRVDENQALDARAGSLRVFLVVALLVVTLAVAGVVLLAVTFALTRMDMSVSSLLQKIPHRG